MPVIRKLVAVVAADVVGYSRLMERDEAGTHERLRKLRNELIDPKIAEHGGRIVHTSGDGMLLEFPSATSALRCAVEVQRELGARNLYVAADEKIEVRIGINLGDIIVEGDDIIGDGVNIAARLETLAEPGGICVASAIWEQVHEDLGIEFVDAGEQQVKNIAKPIRVFRVALGKGSAPSANLSPPARAAGWGRFGGRRTAIAAAAFVAIVGVGAAMWLWMPRQPIATTATAAGESPLHSVLIVPLEAVAGDSTLAEAARRLTTDVTRALGDSMSDVRVAPASVAAGFAGKSGDARVVGREANVRFLIQGDLRPSGAQVALTLRLVDTGDGRQIQTERRTIELKELGEHDALARQFTSIARAMLIDAISRAAPASSGTSAATARDLVERAAAITNSDPVAAARERRRLTGEAIRLDPDFAAAWELRAASSLEFLLFDFSVDRDRVLADADADSLRAVTLDPRDPLGWAIRGSVLGFRGNLDAAFAANDRSRELDPTRFFVVFLRGYLFMLAGKPEEALKIVEVLRRVGLLEPESYDLACNAHMALGAYNEAIVACERAATNGETWSMVANLTAAHAMRGDADKAAQTKARLLKVQPAFTIGRYEARRLASTPAAVAQEKAHLVAGLRKAGVPE